MESINAVEGTNLVHFFDADLQYQLDVEPVVPAEGREGVLSGNGDG